VRCGWCWSIRRVRVAVGGDLFGRREVGADPGVGSEVGRQAEIDGGSRPGPTTGELEEIEHLKREVGELRRADEILKAASAFFGAELDRQSRR
jgi:transposase